MFALNAAPAAASVRLAPKTTSRRVVANGKGAEYTVAPVQADTVNGVEADTVQDCINAIR